MPGQNEIISLLDQAKYLYLRQISEPEENSLRLVVEEAIVDRSEMVSPPEPASPFAEIRKGAWPIKSTDKCKAFELQWGRYVAYLVTEEVVGSGGSDEDQVYTGSLFRVYTKSHFLDHLSRDTGSHIEPVLHYKLICQNHLIDVASYSPPEVRLLSTLPKSGGTEVRPTEPSLELGCSRLTPSAGERRFQRREWGDTSPLSVTYPLAPRTGSYDSEPS